MLSRVPGRRLGRVCGDQHGTTMAGANGNIYIDFDASGDGGCDDPAAQQS
jgi:hypothetical protein